MKIKILSVVILFLLMNGCKGEKGDSGPTGPAGSANVKTLKFTVTTSDWLDAGTNAVYYTKMTSLITKSISDAGTVLLFYQIGSDIWVALPNSFVHSSGGVFTVQYIYGLDGGNGRLEVGMGSSTISSSSLKTNVTFKVVIVDGQLGSGNIDTNNYESVKKYLMLED